MVRCECEHTAHLEKGKTTPNGNSGHKYGAMFSLFYMELISTPYGTYHVCTDCAHDCALIGWGAISWC